MRLFPIPLPSLSFLPLFPLPPLRSPPPTTLVHSASTPLSLSLLVQSPPSHLLDNRQPSLQSPFGAFLTFLIWLFVFPLSLLLHISLPSDQISPFSSPRYPDDSIF